MAVVRVQAGAGRESLLPYLESAAETSRAVNFLSSEPSSPVPWARLHDDARGVAAALQAKGLGPGSHVAVIGHTAAPVLTAIQASWLIGAAVLVPSLRTRLTSAEEHAAQTSTRLRAARCDAVFVDGEHDGVLAEQTATLDELMAEGASLPADRYERPEEDPEAVAVLQFTSGSTSDPRAVVVPHADVVANMLSFSHRLDVDPERDVFVTWLPLYHDMGLFETMTMPMMLGCTLHIAATRDFLNGPRKWMEWMDTYGGTFTMGPNVSYAMTSRLLDRATGMDLSKGRAIGNGSEMIDPNVVRAFLDAAAGRGLDRRNAFAAYGLAEATLAVTSTRPGDGMWFDSVDPLALENDRLARAVAPDTPGVRELASCGPPLPGFEVRIVRDDGEVASGRELGEVQVIGPSVARGYFERPDDTAELFDGPWLRTGDLGYLVDGELVVCGRTKDVIIVSGRNIFPEDIELAAASVDGVRAGNVIAFGAPGRLGREGVVVVAEAAADAAAGAIRQAVAAAVREAVGVQPHDVVLIAPGSLPKTTSGKLQRSRCRAQYAGGELVEP